MHELSLLIEKDPFTLSFIGGIEKQQTIVHFRSPIDSKSQALTKLKSGTPHITHHTIHSHNTYELEVSQNIKDTNDCFLFKQKISKVEQNSLFFEKQEKEKKAIQRQKHQDKCFFIPVFFL